MISYGVDVWRRGLVYGLFNWIGDGMVYSGFYGSVGGP